jgi:hypothetical protein
VEQKPGYKTTEFWLSMAALILGALLASGVIPEGGWISKLVGGGLAALGQLGYSWSRTKVKAEAVKAEATMLAAKLGGEEAPTG